MTIGWPFSESLAAWLFVKLFIAHFHVALNVPWHILSPWLTRCVFLLSHFSLSCCPSSSSSSSTSTFSSCRCCSWPLDHSTGQIKGSREKWQASLYRYSPMNCLSWPRTFFFLVLTPSSKPGGYFSLQSPARVMMTIFRRDNAVKWHTRVDLFCVLEYISLGPMPFNLIYPLACSVFEVRLALALSLSYTHT